MTEKPRYIFTKLKKMYLFGADGAEKFIDKLGYDKSGWQELLGGMRAYAEDDFYMDDPNGLVFPSEILEPPVIDNFNGKKNFHPCSHCWPKGFIFWTWGVRGGFCEKFLECEYVKNSPRGDIPDKNESRREIYRRYRELYLNSDIDLLRVIDDTLRLYHGLESFELEDSRGLLLMDIAVTLNRRGIVPYDKVFLSEFFDPDRSYGQFLKARESSRTVSVSIVTDSSGKSGVKVEYFDEDDDI